MTPLTQKQQELLNYLKSSDRCPSFDEMREALDLKSKSGVHRLVTALVERGYVRRLRNRARAIEVVEDPGLPHELEHFNMFELAAEARRRGLRLGHIERDARGHRSFVEIGDA